MRVLAISCVVGLVVGACATDPNGAPDVTASTALSPSKPAVDPSNEIMRTKAALSPVQAKRPAPDTRDRSKIPATDDVREAEVLRQHGEWTIVRSKDATTDEISCTAVHKKGGRFQLGNDGLYVNLRGNGGGADSYRLSYDDKPAVGVRLTVPLDQIALKDMGKLKSAKRVKLYVQTVVKDNVEVDLDLKGLREAHNMLNAPECAS